jgi:WD40 repeat protein
VGSPLTHGTAVTQVAFSPDGTRLLTAGRDGVARVWKLPDGKPLSAPLKHGAEITFAAFSGDGRLVVTGGALGPKGMAATRVWDWAAAKLVAKPMAHIQPVARAVISSDGRRVLAATEKHRFRGWDLTENRAVSLPWDDTRGTQGPWFSPDGRRVLAAEGTEARVYDLMTGGAVAPALTHGGKVNAAEFSADGRLIATAGGDRIVRVWETATGRAVTPPLAHARRLAGVAFDRSGERLLTVCEAGAVRLWDLRRREQLSQSLPLRVGWEVVAVGPGGREVLARSTTAARVWDMSAGAFVGAEMPAAKARQAAFSPDGKRFVTVGAESVELWQVRAPKAKGRVLGPAAGVRQVTFTPNGSRVAALSEGEQLRVWDATTAVQVYAGKLPREAPWDVPALSSDGRLALGRRFPNAAQVWNVSKQKGVPPLLRHTGQVLHAGFSPDGRGVATTTADGEAHLLDPATQTPLTPPLAHGPYLRQTVFSLDGSRLATIGSDGTARVWDARTGQPLTPLFEQHEPILAASFSPEGHRLATVAKGNEVRVWDLRPASAPVADLVDLAHALSAQEMNVASGSVVPLGPDRLCQTWDRVRARRPTEMGAH